MKRENNYKKYFKSSAPVLKQLFVHEKAIKIFSPTAAYIFGHLAFNISKHGKATDCKITISKRILCERKTVQLSIKSLISMNWIEQIEDRSTPSGYAFIFGHRIPRDVQSAYRALHDRLEKNRKTGFLIQVELHSFKNAGKVEINRKKASAWRMLAYLRGLLAYRNASYSRRCSKNFARAKFTNKTWLAEHLNIALSTLRRYLRTLQNLGEIYIVRQWDGLYIDARGDLMEKTKLISKRLARKTNFLN